MKVSGKMKVEFYMSEYEGENAFLILGAWSRAAKNKDFLKTKLILFCKMHNPVIMNIYVK